MDKKKPDYWNDLPQVMGNWPNLAAVGISTYLYYYIEGKKEVLSIVIFALVFSLLLYTMLYFRKYYIYKKNERKNALSESNECPDCEVLSAEFIRKDSKNRNECSVKRTLVSKINGMKYYRYRYRVLGHRDFVLKVYSSTHEIRYECLPSDSHQWEICLVTFIRPLRYEEYAKLEFVHSGNNWKPIQFIRVNTPMKYFSFEIKLDLVDSPPAKLLMIPIDGRGSNIIEQTEIIIYDKEHQCYSVKKENPVTGYTYQLNWGMES